MNIKAVVYDMGGVLLNLDMDRCIRSFKEKAGFAEIENYLDKFHQKGFIGELEAGDIGPETFYEKALSHCPAGTSKETVHECFMELLDGLNPEAVKTVQALHGKYDLYILSNNNPISSKAFGQMKDDRGVPIFDYFKGTFFSFQMKLLKPCREIYEKMIEGTGCRPEEILFIDDSETNIAAAGALGIRTLLYKPGTDILGALQAPDRK